MQKQIHVNSYVKRDGTQVKEHFRTIDTDNYGTPPIFSEYPNYPIMDEKNYNLVKNFLSNILNPTMNMESAPVLQGGVSVDVGFPTGSGAGDVGAGAGLGNILSDVSGVLGTVAAVGLELAPIALQMYQAINNGNGQAVEYLRPQFDTKMKQLDTQVAQMKTNIDNNITKLVNTKNQVDYTKIYEPLQKDWQAYQSAKNIVNRIKVHANNEDFQSVANDLGNFVSESPIGKTIITNSLMQNIITNLRQNSSKILNAENIDDLFKNNAQSLIPKYNNIPILPKYFSDLAIKNLAQLTNNILNNSRPEAHQLMDLSLNLPEDTYNNSEYSMIQPIFNEQLNNYLQSNGMKPFIPKDMKGIVFDKSSPLSQKLSNLKQLQNDVRKELTKNPDVKCITGLGIDTDKNLQYAIGNYTIINPHIENGIFKGTLIDIYDYHLLLKLSHSINFKTLVINDLAFLLQLIGIIKNYYSIIPIEFVL